MKRDFTKLCNEGERACPESYSLSLDELQKLIVEASKDSNMLMETISRAFYAGFACGMRKTKAEQKRA